jgi:hypothetical protein
MTLAHMQSHDLTRLRIHPKESCMVDDFYRLGIGVKFPIVEQSMFNDQRYRLGRHILEKIFLLFNLDLAAQSHAVSKDSSTW